MKRKLTRLYAEGSTDTKTVIVNDTAFTIIKLPARYAMKVFNKTLRIGSPLINIVSIDKDKELDFSTLSTLDDDALSDHIIDIVEMCQTDDRMVVYDADIKDLKTPYLLAFEFLKFNYENFLQSNPKLRKAAEKVTGLNLKEMVKNS